MIIASSFWTYLKDTTVTAPVGIDGENFIYAITISIFTVCFVRIIYYAINYSIAHKDKIMKAKQSFGYIFTIMLLGATAFAILGISKGIFELIMNL